MRRAFCCAALLVLAVTASTADASSAALPPIRHVFIIVLENKNADTTFGAQSPAPYLAHTLPREGEMMPGYYGIGHVSLDNYVAMVSGQPPNPQTQSDCQFYTEFAPGTVGSDGIATGQGCVYPAAVKTIANQLRDTGLTWKGYMEDMGADPARDNGTTCAHPPLNAHDPTQTAAANDQYATRHNPFVYFHAIIDTPACAADDLPLTRLQDDLASPQSTPNLAFITPDLCHDAHDPTCPDGGPGGLPAADAFLQTWVPKITASPAFQRDGLLIVTFDESENDSSACCDEPPGPNTPSPGGAEPGPGGGRIGAVLVSPYITPGSTTTQSYNHYSLLRSLEDLFGLSHLGYAASPGLRAFGEDVFNRTPGLGPAPACTTIVITGRPRRLPAGTMLTGTRVRRRGARRVVSFHAAHGTRVTVHAGRRSLHRRVRACRSYALSIPRRGRVEITARTPTHVERETLTSAR